METLNPLVRRAGALSVEALRRGVLGVAISVGVVGLLSACGSAAKKAPPLPADTLRTLVLRPGDAPGFSSFDSGRQVGIDAHSGPRRATDRFGRQDGWKARYRRVDSGAKTGPLVLESRADVFATDDGAGKDIDAYVEEWKQTVRVAASPSAGAAQYPDVHLGDEARALDLLQGTRASGQRLIVVAWRRGRITASLAASGYPSLKVEDALALARKQDRRVETAGR